MAEWAVFSAMVKIWNLASMAAVIGGGFCFYLFRRHALEISRVHLRYLFGGGISGLVSTMLFFLTEVGKVNQAGITGAFDMSMAAILLDTGLGVSSILRLTGYSIVALIALVRLYRSTEGNTHSAFGEGLFVAPGLAISFLALGFSFALSGHTVELGSVVRLAVVLHVLAGLTWIGSLYPLIRVSANHEVTVTRVLMSAFGDWMIPILLVLLLTGSLLVFSVLEFPGMLFTTRYGTGLFVKLSLVACLLLLGACNRFQHVPKLEFTDSRAVLQRSISAEMVLAIFVLSVTSYITTVIGIENA